MLKAQASEESALGFNFVCTVRAFGGFRIESLSKKIDLVKRCTKKYYDAAIVLVGTIDLISDDFEILTFLDRFKKLLLKLNNQLEPKCVVVIGYFPRAFCKKLSCDPGRCLYVHPGFGKNQPVDLNIRISKVNKRINELIQYDVRFQSFKFVDFCSRVFNLGTLRTSFGNFLSYDGLHLSNIGNEYVDKWLTKFLNDKEW